MIGTGVVGPRLRCTYLTLCVLWLTATLLVGWFLPDVFRQLQDVDIIESEVGGVVATEDKQFVLSNGTGGVVGPREGDLSLAGLCAPLYVVGHHLDSVDFVVGT